MDVATGIIGPSVAVTAMVHKWRWTWASMLEDNRKGWEERRKKAEPPDVSDQPPGP